MQTPVMIRFLFLLFCLSCAPALSVRTYAQDPDIEEDERSVLEDIFRSSDHDGSVPTNARQRKGKTKRVSVPDGAFRIGCVCMDESASATRSTGACSGHGGVRYWLYRTKEGDTVRVLTGRHERHPQALNAEEMSNLAQVRTQRTKNLTGSPEARSAAIAPVMIMPAPAVHDGYFDWSDAAAISAMGLSLFFTVRMVLRWINHNEKLVRYALRNMLRRRKRPIARQNRQTPPKEGL